MNNFLKPLATLGLSWVSLSLAFSPAQSASLSLDQNFRTPSFARANPATHTVLLPDGKFLLFSGTDTLTDQRTGALTRHFADGSLDSSFHFTREYKMVTAVAPLADGQLIVVATRGTYDVGSISDGLGSTASWVLRVNPDGSIDSTFNSAAGNSAPLALIAEVVVQPDGKILLAGWFTSFAGLNCQAIARLLANGMVDPSFTSPL